MKEKNDNNRKTLLREKQNVRIVMEKSLILSLRVSLQVLSVIRSNYDTLTLKLQENLDHYEKYSEKPKEAAFFTQLVSTCVQKTVLTYKSVTNFKLWVVHLKMFILIAEGMKSYENLLKLLKHNYIENYRTDSKHSLCRGLAYHLLIYLVVY